MDRQLSAWQCAVTTDAADTFITWPLIWPIADTDWVSVWCRNAWTDYAGLASCALFILVADYNLGGAEFWKRAGWEDVPGAVPMGIDV